MKAALGAAALGLALVATGCKPDDTFRISCDKQ